MTPGTSCRIVSMSLWKIAGAEATPREDVYIDTTLGVNLLSDMAETFHPV